MHIHIPWPYSYAMAAWKQGYIQEVTASICVTVMGTNI